MVNVPTELKKLRVGGLYKVSYPHNCPPIVLYFKNFAPKEYVKCNYFYELYIMNGRYAVELKNGVSFLVLDVNLTDYTFTLLFGKKKHVFDGVGNLTGTSEQRTLSSRHIAFDAWLKEVTEND